ncbi:MAG: hypothetical protein N4Q11_06335, partial [Lactobacillus iners]|nr:hypothetical protein [Lactobacillus iners]
YSEQAYLLSDLLNDHEQFSNCGLVLDVTNPADPLATNLNWMLLDPRFELEKSMLALKRLSLFLQLYRIMATFHLVRKI